MFGFGPVEWAIYEMIQEWHLDWIQWDRATNEGMPDGRDRTGE